MVTKVTIWSFLEPLLYSEDFKHLAEISRELKIQHTTTRKYLNLLEKRGVLTKDYRGTLTMYKLNYGNQLIQQHIAIAEKERLINKCLKDNLLKEIVSFLNNLNNKEILIFGSAIDNAKKANDIDLLIIGNINKNKIRELESKTNIKFHIINVGKIKEINKGLKNEIISKHLIVSGSEELIKWMLKN